ncbi:error-prone DNA polymerase [Flavobacterium sp. MAH-1]|uniref:Error-prone DNA polymerase n=1 Tax=Flavobacterium agri TaxID=2743471 RepID=A0A7Y8Y3I2_9FLAO|nr:error-prone DNA polymerase [Flavobacterium agri]NUY81925.1 error-prone DNA polymerase [Flavobacterium agri]NYA71949.1 error-prone DNA polymerase [Flavobacterium agri]
MTYVELQVTTNFSFLRGGSHPEEFVDQAVALGYNEIAVTDRNTLAGVVRAHVAAKKAGLRLIVGCRLELLDGPPLLAYPTDKESYARLSALLSTGNLRAEKGQCHLYKSDVYAHAEGMKFIAIAPFSLDEAFDFENKFKFGLREYRRRLGKNLYLGANRSYQANDNKRLHRLGQLSRSFDIPLAATNDIHYHVPERRQLQDVLTCIREKCTIQAAGFKLYQNAERYLKPAGEMERLFRRFPEALRTTLEIADACRFSLDSLEYVYPKEITSGDRTPQQELEMLTWQGANERFGGNIPEKIAETIRYELEFMARKDYAAYFLTVYDFVRFARSRDILCQGRGSAANSVVCYCLGITSVDPSKFKVLFARFMSDARDEPPDIDVDFEHERREEVIQYIYEKYGRDRAAIVATVTQVHQKGAIRDVAKAMGLSADAVDRLAGSVWEFTDEWIDGDRVSSEGFDPSDPHLMKVLELTRQYVGFPRQLGQHTGGFIITQDKLSDLCPILNARMEDRTNIEWNKDDIEALGFLKVDVLALGMLTCIRKAFDLCKVHYGLDLTLANIPQDEPEVYEMISHADTLGVFQIESRAQMSMLPRLKPRCFYDLVIEVAIVRPGPIQGDMVHPYLRRRDGIDPVEFPSEELREILGRTLGVPLFQEQAMEIAIVAAGFTPAEADGLRRSMATFKAKGKVSDWEKKLVEGMMAKGYQEDFAKRVFRQLEGFGSYGFPESHAASFALLVYVSSWIKCHYPDVFAAALLNSMPMGFYQPAQVVIDARKHGVEVTAVDINHSYWDNTLEEKSGKYHVLRLGFRQVKGLSAESMQCLLEARKKPFRHINSLLDAGVSIAALEKLADADAFRSIGLDRRQALWEVSALSDSPIGLFKGQSSQSVDEPQLRLPLMTDAAHVVEDYAATGLSIKAHPVSFVRKQLDSLGITPTAKLAQMKNGDTVKVAGLITVRQRPGTAKGVLFVTIEDESNFANIVVWEKVFEKHRRDIIRARLLMVEGRLQVQGEVIHVVADGCFNLSHLLRGMVENQKAESAVSTLSRSDEKNTEEVFYKGRNFR